MNPQNLAEQLMRACEVVSAANLDRVQELVSEGKVDVNYVSERSSYRMTPLHQACLCGFVEAVEILLEHPDIDVNKGKFDGETAFSIAFWKNQLKVIELMVRDPRVEVNTRRRDGATGAWFAARDGLDAAFFTVMASGRFVEDKDPDNPYSISHVAIMNNRHLICDIMELYAQAPWLAVLQAARHLGNLRRWSHCPTPFPVSRFPTSIFGFCFFFFCFFSPESCRVFCPRGVYV